MVAAAGSRWHPNHDISRVIDNIAFARTSHHPATTGTDSHGNGVTVTPRSNFPPAKSTGPGYNPNFGTTGREKQSVRRFISGANPTFRTEKLSFSVQFVESALEAGSISSSIQCLHSSMRWRDRNV